MSSKPVLVTGATGYVGGRLVPRLIDRGHRVRAMARSMDKVRGRPWAGHPDVELVYGDVLDIHSLTEACRGCRAAYYLVHSMNPQTRDFALADRQAATNMVAAAADGSLERLIYLGGLVPDDISLSPHLASRAEVGLILKSGQTPVTVLRAAMILGSGSASFEIMRYLVDRLPIMIAPDWIKNQVQPISIRNVLNYLVGCLEHHAVLGNTYDICGPEILTYEQLFQIYAEEAGLARRRILTLPIHSSALISYLVHLITPVHISLVGPLIEGLRHDVFCRDTRLADLIPQDLMDCRRVIRRVMVKRRRRLVETAWMDAGLLRPPEWVQLGDQSYAGGAVISVAYHIFIQADPAEVWRPLALIGGETGWYHADFLWHIRGWLDKILGGVSHRRGRRHPSELAVGDALDFWRILVVKPPRRLVLLGEMKAPGEAILSFELRPTTDGQTELRLIARFFPRGLWGLAYWYGLIPFHDWIFKGTLKGIADRTGRPITTGPRRIRPNQG